MIRNCKINLALDIFIYIMYRIEIIVLIICSFDDIKHKSKLKIKFLK